MTGDILDYKDTEWLSTFPTTTSGITKWEVPVPKEEVQPMADLRPAPPEPKFFLHDEIIYWLKRNMKLHITHDAPNKYSYGHNEAKYDARISVSIRIADEHITNETIILPDQTAYDMLQAQTDIRKLTDDVLELQETILSLTEQLKNKSQ